MAKALAKVIVQNEEDPIRIKIGANQREQLKTWNRFLCHFYWSHPHIDSVGFSKMVLRKLTTQRSSCMLSANFCILCVNV